MPLSVLIRWRRRRGGGLRLVQLLLELLLLLRNLLEPLLNAILVDVATIRLLSFHGHASLFLIQLLDLLLDRGAIHPRGGAPGALSS